MQLVEFFAWSDLLCSNGLNKLSAKLGAILNNSQPVILFILTIIYLKSENIIPIQIVVILNITYLIYMFYKYYYFINDENNLCIGTNKLNHLEWTWSHNYDYNFYHILIFINIINYYTSINLMTSIIFSYVLLGFVILNLKQNIGEIWCLMVTGVPLLNLLLQKVFGINY
jgi:hypothetical protein